MRKYLGPTYKIFKLLTKTKKKTKQNKQKTNKQKIHTLMILGLIYVICCEILNYFLYVSSKFILKK